MTADVHQAHAALAARLALEGFASLCGLDLDASRVALLQPLAAVLLLHGQRLTQTSDPAVEPFFIVSPQSGSPS